MFVDKDEIQSIPSGFELRGITVNGLWGVYEQERGHRHIRITELPTHYTVSVSSSVSTDYELSQAPLQSTQSSDQLGKLAALGAGAAGILAVGEAIRRSRNNSTPDTEQSHRVFISHSWAYENDYEEVRDLLNGARGFEYFNHSVSSEDPLDAQLPNHLRKKICDQMRSASVVLVLGGMYVEYSDWIQEEIEIANEMEKPIIGVKPQRNERIPNTVHEHATEVVEADGTEILDAINRHSA
ncbi:TIR domain-containing protein [Halorubrum sp. AD140]|uniref:TIR domain-containing protein n=1 Tax=Halorubrum sp. AD140 TaxID=3050073 RepID=UPI002ACC55CD|nr:TIR domain-containing protein [Halorubrum sp. AD140]MDZ5812404.1 TIR domain-containing protein [Halorubrum sp. AD140]